MKLFIIRHGESTWNSRGLIQGNRDPYLSEKGKVQAKELARYLKDCKIRNIFSSDLRRASQTACVLSKSLAVPVARMPELREIGLGFWEGKKIRGLDEKYKKLYDLWIKGPSKVKVPGAEKVPVFCKRICRAFEKIIRSSGEEDNIAVVTHGGAICAYLSRVLKADIDRLLVSVKLDNAGLTFVEVFQKKYFWLRAVNDTAYLNR